MQMNHIKNIWKCFEEKHSAIAKWLYQIFYFVIFSMGVTVFQYLVFTFLPGILGIGLAGTEFMWPKVSMNLFGVKFTWSFYIQIIQPDKLCRKRNPSFLAKKIKKQYRQYSCSIVIYHGYGSKQKIHQKHEANHKKRYPFLLFLLCLFNDLYR